jgi:hypothetical protein
VHGSESSSGLVIPPTPGGIGHSGLEVLERMGAAYFKLP